MPRLPSFVKLPPHKKFNFSARYYDAEKEELEQRVKAAENASPSEEGMKLRLSHHFQNNRFSASRGKAGQKSNLRVVLIFIALSLLTYWLVF